MSSSRLAKEDVEAVQRLRQLYPPHVLASLFDGANAALLKTQARESVSSFSSGSARSSVSSSPRNHAYRNTSASYTSLIPAIDERAVSPNPSTVQSLKASSSTVSHNSRAITRSVSDYAIREHTLNVRSFSQQVATAHPVYFCVHCGHGFEKRADWETHEWIFHERQSYWPCPQPGCHAFFDSGRGFEAHHQAVHGCGKCTHGEKVAQPLPERKAWACGFAQCKEVFLDWSRRCKHVAAHYEGLARRHGNFRESPEWSYSTVVRNLLRQPELRDPFKKFMVRAHGYSKSAWPKLEWQPDKCAELQRCLEYRDFQRGIQDVVHLAYRLGHPRYAKHISRPATPPLEDLLSAASASIRSGRTRSRSIRSARSVMSGSTLAPLSPEHSFSYKPYAYDRKTLDYEKIEQASNLPFAKFIDGNPPSLYTSMASSGGPVQMPRGISSTDLLRPATSSRKRMVAREPEVRGTTSRALLDFLHDGPPTGPTKGEHRARRIPHAIVLPSRAFESTLNDDTYTPIPDRVTPDSIVQAAPIVNVGSLDRSASPLLEDRRRQDSNFGSAVPQDEEQQTRNAIAHMEIASDRIQQTILEFKTATLHPTNPVQKILPPTPGPPPTQSLPLPPPPPSLSPPTIHYPDTPTSIYESDVPPSPMPPGFTDIAMWPAPPPNAISQDPSSEPEGPNVTDVEIPRPATVRTTQPEVIRLMSPPKRARSVSRGSRPRPLRWASLNTLVDPPTSQDIRLDSPITQSLDASQPAPPPAVVVYNV